MDKGYTKLQIVSIFQQKLFKNIRVQFGNFLEKLRFQNSKDNTKLHILTFTNLFPN